MRFCVWALLLSTLVSCAGKGGGSNTTIRIPRAITVTGFHGMFYGRHTGSGKRFAKYFDEGMTQITLTLMNGTWEFAMISWEKPDPVLTGDAPCFTGQSTLNGSATTIAAEMTLTKCSEAIFGGPNFGDASGGIATNVIWNCNDVSGITAWGDNCHGFNRGFNRSFKFHMMEYDEYQGTQVTALTSACQVMPTAEGSLATDLRIPVGSASGLFAMEVEGFASNDCSGVSRKITANKGLQDDGVKVFDNGGLTHVFFEDEGVDELALLGSINASASGGSSAPTFTLSSNGTPLYIFAGAVYDNQPVYTDLKLDGTLGKVLPSPTNNSFGMAYPQVHNNLYFFQANDTDNEVRDLFRFNPTTLLTDNLTNHNIIPNTWGDGVKSAQAIGDNEVYYVFQDQNNSIQSLCSVPLTSLAAPSCGLQGAGTEAPFSIIGHVNGSLYYSAIKTSGGDLMVYKFDGTNHTEAMNLTGLSLTAHSSTEGFHKIGTYTVALLSTSPSPVMLGIDSAGAVSLIGNIPTASQKPYKAADGSLYFLLEQNGAYAPVRIDSSGTTTFPSNLTDLQTGATFVAMLGNQLFFVMDNDGGGAGNVDLFYWTGSGAMVPVADHPISLPASDYEYFVLNDHLLFKGNSGAEGEEPWITDGSTTHTLGDVTSGASSSYLYSIRQGVFFSGNYYFPVTDGTSSEVELYVSNGTANSISKLDLCPSSCSSDPKALITTDHFIYFVGNTNGANARWHRMGTTITSVTELSSTNTPAYAARVLNFDTEKLLTISDSSNNIYHYTVKTR